MNITINLSEKGIRRLQKDIDKFVKDALDRKLKIFIERLAELGIQTGNENLGSFAQYITISKKLSVTETGYSEMVVFVEKAQILSKWYHHKSDAEPLVYYVSPLLMAEFGAGTHAVAPRTLSDGTQVGQGTFPAARENGYETHAFQSSWVYLDEDKNTKASFGVVPTQPVYKAWEAMKLQIETIANEVFGGGV